MYTLISSLDRPTRQRCSLVMAAVLLMLSPAITPALAATPPITDQAITDAVEDELVHDPAVHTAAIDVQTAEGSVTLSGTVNHLLAKERAARIAETVKGVRAVVNMLKVKMAQDVSDEALRQEVITALQGDPVSDILDINTHVAHGVVTLIGTVQSWREKHAAAVNSGAIALCSIDKSFSSKYHISTQSLARILMAHSARASGSLRGHQ